MMLFINLNKFLSQNNRDRLLSVLVKPCNRSDANVELFKGVTHQDLEEATREVLKKNDIEVR